MQAEMERRLTQERDLAAALDNGELSMHTQVQVNSGGVPVGAEMLMRRRRLGLTSPSFGNTSLRTA